MSLINHWTSSIKSIFYSWNFMKKNHENLFVNRKTFSLKEIDYMCQLEKWSLTILILITPIKSILAFPVTKLQGEI